MNYEPNPKYTNFVVHADEFVFSCDEKVFCSANLEPPVHCENRCTHSELFSSSSVVTVFGVNFCASIDTGAQVKLLSEDIL